MSTSDSDKIDEAVLALLLLGRHDEMRVWKGHDWDALDRRARDLARGPDNWIVLSDPSGRQLVNTRPGSPLIRTC